MPEVCNNLHEASTTGFSLNRALQLGLPKYMTDIDEMSEYARKEYSVERMLDKMQVGGGGGRRRGGGAGGRGDELGICYMAVIAC